MEPRDSERAERCVLLTDGFRLLLMVCRRKVVEPMTLAVNLYLLFNSGNVNGTFLKEKLCVFFIFIDNRFVVCQFLRPVKFSFQHYRYYMQCLTSYLYSQFQERPLIFMNLISFVAFV